MAIDGVDDIARGQLILETDQGTILSVIPIDLPYLGY